MTDHKIFNVLFLSTGNSSRSILAEAMLNALGKGRFHAYSAGSHPAGVVNPNAVEQIQHLRFPLGEPRSKSWDEFARLNAPHMDFVITVCDSAAGEACPTWPGQPIAAHWGFEDPATFAGSDEQKRALFAKISAISRRGSTSSACCPWKSFRAWRSSASWTGSAAKLPLHPLLPRKIPTWQTRFTTSYSCAPATPRVA